MWTSHALFLRSILILKSENLDLFYFCSCSHDLNIHQLFWRVWKGPHVTNVEWISSSYSKNQELDTMSDYLKIQFWNTELNYFLNEKYWIIVWVKMILFFISLHHKTLPLLNKCAVSCWLSTVKKTRNGGSFKISLVHRMTSTNIKMYEVNLWQCNQSTWKSRKHSV